MSSIMFVDDDRDSLTIYQRAVSLEGHQAHLIPSGEEALDRVGDIQPDVIVLDFNLPDMSGMYVLEQIRQDPMTRDIPIIILTAHDETEIADQLSTAGADAFFSKPLSLSEFLAALEQFL